MALENDRWQFPPFANGGARQALASVCFYVLDLPEPPTVIIADDTSGRIPSLVLREALRPETDMPPKHYFISGTATPDSKAGFRLNPDDSVLVVSEMIHSGRSVLSIIRRIVSDFGVPEHNHRVVSVAANAQGRNNLKFYLPKNELFIGSTHEQDGNYYRDRNNFSGVKKGVGSVHSVRRFGHDQPSVRLARNEARKLGQIIHSDWLKSKNT